MPTATPQVQTPKEESINESVLQNQAISVGHMYRDRVAKTPNAPAYQFAHVKPEGDTWETITWAQTKERTDAISAGLIALGV